VIGDNRFSKISVCLEAAPAFLLPADAAAAIVARQVTVIAICGSKSANEAALSTIDRRCSGGVSFSTRSLSKGAAGHFRAAGE